MRNHTLLTTLKKATIFILTLILTCMLVGCSNSNTQPKALISYNNETSVKNSESIDVKLLENFPRKQPYIKIGSYSSLQPLDLLDKKAISATRFSNGRYYTVSKLSDEKYLFLMFNFNEETHQTDLIDSFEATTLLDKDCIKSIKIGSASDDVKKADPTAYYDDSFSVHRFSDKSVVEICYEKGTDGKQIVSDISEIDTSDSVLSYLLPIDLELIIK